MDGITARGKEHRPQKPGKGSYGRSSPTPRLSRYAFIIIRNGRRRVKSLSAPWAYQLPLNFLLFKRTLVPSSVPTLGSVPLLPRFIPLAAIRDASSEPHRRAPPT